ncbi:hypothetical protein B0G83_102671 [Paraburkholderia sp. BL21I4N1]|nr:hypothetical protein B0G83_102671 [Paraburkholderia sp. BL21I4N1]
MAGRRYMRLAYLNPKQSLDQPKAADLIRMLTSLGHSFVARAATNSACGTGLVIAPDSTALVT